jgi:hypothetical protein
MMKLFWSVMVLILACTAGAAQAKGSARLKKQCTAMAFTAHPASLPDITAVRNLRRDYYNLCIARRGKMDPLR